MCQGQHFDGACRSGAGAKSGSCANLLCDAEIPGGGTARWRKPDRRSTATLTSQKRAACAALSGSRRQLSRGPVVFQARSLRIAGTDQAPSVADPRDRGWSPSNRAVVLARDAFARELEGPRASGMSGLYNRRRPRKSVPTALNTFQSRARRAGAGLALFNCDATHEESAC